MFIISNLFYFITGIIFSFLIIPILQNISDYTASLFSIGISNSNFKISKIQNNINNISQENDIESNVVGFKVGDILDDCDDENYDCDDFYSV